MLRKIWRYSHLYLALSSSLFLLLAAVTGAILSFEPIQKQMALGHATDISEVSLSEIIPKIQNEYDEVFEIKRSEDDIIYVSAINLEKEIDGEYIIDLQSGEAVQEYPKQSEFYAFITSLHRSLFLKKSGRWLVGINSFFLLMMVITGLMLIIKRQHGLKNIFKKIIRLDFPSYSHTYLGRLMLLPLAIISLSAVSLFLIRFEYLPNQQEEAIVYDIDNALQNKQITDFKVFQDYSLADINTVEFPFSEFEDDYFILNLTDKTIYIHQYTGQIIEEIPKESIGKLYDLSYFLHTGKGSILWSVILCISSLSILYFIYSGLQMALPRLRRKTANSFKAEEAEFVVLYGSESGSTQHFAALFFKALLDKNLKAYITSLNNYQVFPSLKNLIIFTSTHGKGEAPHNAYYFMDRLNENYNNQPISYAVVGFGSSHYPDFCAFAKEVNAILGSKDNFTEDLPIHLIDNQSSASIKSWWQTWSQKHGIDTKIPARLHEQHALKKFKIISKDLMDDGFGITFLLTIKPKNDVKSSSGDLLGVFPPKEKVERFYSMGKINANEFLLAVKLHPNGVCSNYLNNLNVGDSFKAYIKPNPSFHLELSAPSITYISNGTGITPFLGMIKNYAGEQYFYWGGRKRVSWDLYSKHIDDSTLNEFELVFSRENEGANYIQDLIKTRQAILFYRLNAGGILMFCGSMQMQEDVFSILDAYAKENNLPPMEYWVTQNQVKIDTY